MKTLSAALALALVLGLAAAPTATAHPLPDGWENWRSCHGTLGETIDCTGSQAVGKSLAVAQHACEHLFGTC